MKAVQFSDYLRQHNIFTSAVDYLASYSGHTYERFGRGAKELVQVSRWYYLANLLRLTVLLPFTLLAIGFKISLRWNEKLEIQPEASFNVFLDLENFSWQWIFSAIQPLAGDTSRASIETLSGVQMTSVGVQPLARDPSIGLQETISGVHMTLVAVKRQGPSELTTPRRPARSNEAEGFHTPVSERSSPSSSNALLVESPVKEDKPLSSQVEFETDPSDSLRFFKEAGDLGSADILTDGILNLREDVSALLGMDESEELADAAVVKPDSEEDVSALLGMDGSEELADAQVVKPNLQERLLRDMGQQLGEAYEAFIERVANEWSESVCQAEDDQAKGLLAREEAVRGERFPSNYF